MRNFVKTCIFLAVAATPMVMNLPAQGRRGGAPGGQTAAPRNPNPMNAGSDDSMVTDPAAADRGRKVYAAECINCHGTHARGTDRGADLVRSIVVLHDRYGSGIAPFLKKGHPTQTTPAASLTAEQIVDLSHLIHQEVMATMRNAMEVQNVLTGDAKAGAAYFSGAGKCSSCHSATGDLAGIGKRLEPIGIQQRFMFPMAGRGGRGARVTITVTPSNGPAVTGAPVSVDDFNVSLRDGAGEFHAWKRTAGLKVVRNDPFSAHIALLDAITDKNMHDVTAYLESLK
jgi:mono/diheme cytochrome c family protein